jgi:PEGA domain-containing protein
MRLTLIVLVVFGLSAVAEAQSSVSHSDGWRPSIGLPLPPIGLPLPPIGLPLPPMGLSPRIEHPASIDLQRPPHGSRPGPGIGRQNRRFGQGGLRSGGTILYFVPAFGWPYAEAPTLPGRPAIREEQKPPTGRLRLELQPGIDPQVYVDGYYVGTLYDVNAELTLEAGPHRLELRADGYEIFELDVQISRNRSITYRGELKAVAAPAPVSPVPASPEAPPPPPGSATIYYIPGCYVGNLPPRDAGLPAGCDESRATTLNLRP